MLEVKVHNLSLDYKPFILKRNLMFAQQCSKFLRSESCDLELSSTHNQVT